MFLEEGLSYLATISLEFQDNFYKATLNRIKFKTQLCLFDISFTKCLYQKAVDILQDVTVNASQDTSSWKEFETLLMFR